MNAPPAGRPKPKRNDPLAKEIGEKLRAARLDLEHSEGKPVSQGELGRRLRNRNGKPLPKEQISAYENGRSIPEPRLRLQLARALKKDERELFGAVGAELAEHPKGDTLSYAVLSNRLAKVEAELEDLRQRVEDQEDVTGAKRAAEVADVRDRESKKGARKSHGSRPSKDRPR